MPLQRRQLLLAGLALAAAGMVPRVGAVLAQPGSSGSGGQPLDAATFVRLAHSSATLQLRAAELASSRETRPEARSFAQRMVEFRRGQIPALERAARDNGAAVPSVMEFEHQALLDNLQPLDFLALSRRYAELQTEALAQELRIYAASEGSADAWVKSLAAGTLPPLRQLLVEAQQMRQAVGP